ncbi:MAG: AzlC family ABC transporter permease, partial [Ilumatobacteraceae bacterium]
MSPTDAERKRVVSASLTLGSAVGITALSFGLAAVSSGASVWQACALSFLTFTGASQFSAMSVVGAGGSLWTAFGGATLRAVQTPQCFDLARLKAAYAAPYTSRFTDDASVYEAAGHAVQLVEG